MVLRRASVGITIAALFAALLAALIAAPAAQADAGVEAQVLNKIRNYRSTGRLIVHSGLLSVARMHSMQMSREGRMSHENADQRITNAPPDPAEGNGAPDDGVPVAAWCENVTYSTGHPASEVPGRLFSQWAGSGAHGRCMRDTKRNVGAVGVYYDGTTWWATFIATTDNTPPGAPSGSVGGVKTPKPQPQATQAPAEEPPASQPPAEQPRAAANPSSESVQGAPSPRPAQVAPATSSAPDDSPAASDRPDEADAAEAAALSNRTLDVMTEVGAIDEESAPASSAYGWQELGAVGALIVFASLVAAWRTRQRNRKRRRRNRPVYEPIATVLPPLDERPALEPDRTRELVGV